MTSGINVAKERRSGSTTLRSSTSRSIRKKYVATYYEGKSYVARSYVAKHQIGKLSDVESNVWKESNKYLIFELEMELM